MELSTGRIHVRWMIRDDMPFVLQIEQESFETPWEQEDFLRALRRREVIGQTAEREKKVVGFLIKEFNEDSIQLLNFAVHPFFRRRGVASQMIRHLIGRLDGERRHRLVADVREGNLPAQLFFRKLGFKAIHTLRGWYEDTGEDAYRMEYQIGRNRPREMFAQ